MKDATNTTTKENAMETITQQQAAAVYRAQIREIQATMTPNCEGGRFSGQQINYARGLARRRTVAILDEARERFARRHDGGLR
jgi:hypothetical protein